MPQFYFDVHDPDSPDEDGLVLPDADVACREAARAVAEMLKDVVARGRSGVALRVRDDSGRPTCTVTARITVARF